MKKAVLACIVLSISILIVQLALGERELTFAGYVSCSICLPAKGAKDSHREFMEDCLTKGAAVVLITDEGQDIIRIDNPDTVSGQHSHHVVLSGYMNDSGFHVITVRMLY